MANDPHSPSESPPKSPHGWWPRWRVILCFLLLILIALPAPLWIRSLLVQYYCRRAVAETDSLDPRWRLEHIEADRTKIPDEANAALLIMALVPAVRQGLPFLDQGEEEAVAKLHPTMQLNEKQIAALRDLLSKTGKPVQDARKLKDFTTGRFPIRYADCFIQTLMEEQRKAGVVNYWLMHDASILAQDEQYDEAIASCRAMMVAARSIGDEPLTTSHLMRISYQTTTATAVERVLAQGAAAEAALAALQRLLELEVNESTWQHAARGERAGLAHLYDNLMNGTLPFGKWLGKRPSERDLLDDLREYFPAMELRHIPRAIQIYNQVLEHDKKPIHVRRIELRQLAKELDDNREVASLFTGGVITLHDRDCQSQALLRSTFVGIACERYRLTHNRWPNSLDALVTAKLLDVVPLDPMDGQQLRYRRTDAGIVIYSIGDDDTDNQGKIDREQRDARGLDIGFRLWDVAQRRQLPLGP